VVKSLFSFRQAQHVSLRQIDDVNVIANAGAIGGRIIGAVEFALGGLAQRDLKDVGNQMRFGAVMLSEFFARAGRIEIPEGDEFEPIDLTVPAKKFFKYEL